MPDPLLAHADPTEAPIPAPRHHRHLSLSLGVAALLCGCADLAPLQPLQVASGFTSQMVCIDHFVGGLPVARSLRDRVAPMPGMAWLEWARHTEVDAGQHSVVTTVAGGFSSRAVFRPGLGCQLDQPGGPPDAAAVAAAAAVLQTPAAPALLPPIAGPALVAGDSAALREALASAFDAPDAPDAADPHHTLAVLVMREGRVLGERYAAGLGPQTPILGFSMSKAVVHALAGVLVGQGRLDIAQPAPIPAWRAPGDPRGAITTEQLLRQTAGLDLGWDASGFGAGTRMLFIERDQAGFAATRGVASPAGRVWNYTDANYLLASRVLRDAAGGSAAAVLALAQRQLAQPLGMTGLQLAFDATGTPQGASMFSATARDWARLGQLYLDDGVAGGQRLLPPGWVAAARQPTLDTGYGAGWWTNVHGGEVLPAWGVPWGFGHAPRDAFFARGFMGQFTLVVPSLRLVVVRLGISHQRGDDIAWVNDWLGRVLAALDGEGASVESATARAPG